jgi:hypothetical protein
MRSEGPSAPGARICRASARNTNVPLVQRIAAEARTSLPRRRPGLQVRPRAAALTGAAESCVEKKQTGNPPRSHLADHRAGPGCGFVQQMHFRRAIVPIRRRKTRSGTIRPTARTDARSHAPRFAASSARSGAARKQNVPPEACCGQKKRRGGCRAGRSGASARRTPGEEQPGRPEDQTEDHARAVAPRKLLRVNGGGDKLGYPQATFVPPLIFLQQP